MITLSSAGCGSGSPFDQVDVQGKITYEDGSAIPLTEPVRLQFKSEAPPIDGKYFPRPAMTMLNTDGTFGAITTYKYKDGLVAGKHKVFLRATDASGKLLIPLEYADPETTPLELDTADSPVELQIRKPTEKERNTKVKKTLF